MDKLTIEKNGTKFNAVLLPMTINENTRVVYFYKENGKNFLTGVGSPDKKPAESKFITSTRIV